MVAQVADPVCRMTFDESKSAAIRDHSGTTYHFCSDYCLEKFEAHPDQYITTLGPPRT